MGNCGGERLVKETGLIQCVLHIVEIKEVDSTRDKGVLIGATKSFYEGRKSSIVSGRTVTSGWGTYDGL